MSGALRKLKKSIGSNPVILFAPSENDSRIASIAKDLPNSIIVTDPKLYKKILEGVKFALDTNRKGVVLGELINDYDRPK